MSLRARLSLFVALIVAGVVASVTYLETRAYEAELDRDLVDAARIAAQSAADTLVGYAEPFDVREVRDMLHEALDAFVQSDAEAAEHVLGRDETVDHGCAAIIDAMTAHMSRKPAEVQAGLRVIGVAKYLERIADHATNVAEEVIFMVAGKDVRHLSDPPAAARR